VQQGGEVKVHESTQELPALRLCYPIMNIRDGRQRRYTVSQVRRKAGHPNLQLVFILHVLREWKGCQSLQSLLKAAGGEMAQRVWLFHRRDESNDWRMIPRRNAQKINTKVGEYLVSSSCGSSKRNGGTGRTAIRSLRGSWGVGGTVVS